MTIEHSYFNDAIQCHTDEDGLKGFCLSVCLREFFLATVTVDLLIKVNSKPSICHKIEYNKPKLSFASDNA